MAVADVPSALRSFLEVQSRRAQLYTRFRDGFKAFIRSRLEAQYKSHMTELTASFSECSKIVIVLEAALKDLGRPDLAAILRQVQESEREKLRLTLTLQALRQAAAFRTLSWMQQQQHGLAQGGGCEDPEDDEALALLDPEYAVASRSHGHCCHAHGYNPGHAGGPGQGCGGSVTAGRCAHAADKDGGGEKREAAAPGCEEADVGVRAGGSYQAESGCHVEEAGRTGGGGHAGGCGCGADGGGGALATAPPAEPTRREYEAAVKEAMQELDSCIRTINEAIGDVRMELEDA